jgi:hypothetical protein
MSANPKLWLKAGRFAGVHLRDLSSACSSLTWCSTIDPESFLPVSRSGDQSVLVTNAFSGGELRPDFGQDADCNPNAVRCVPRSIVHGVLASTFTVALLSSNEPFLKQILTLAKLHQNHRKCRVGNSRQADAIGFGCVRGCRQQRL